MQQLVTISFAIKNTKEERNKIIKYMNRHFSIPVQETNNLLDIAYIAELVYFRAIDFELDFPDEYTEEDMFKKLKIALPDVSFTCQINNKTFEHDISIKPENKKVEPTNRNTTNISVTIEKALKELAELEKENCQDIDAAARPFGSLMAELFVWKEDAFQEILRAFGFYLGKFIYMMDAFMDLADDEKKGCYNPFMNRIGEEDLEETIREMLDGTLRMAIAEFEKLPLEQDLPILRNILYEGVWVTDEKKRRK